MMHLKQYITGMLTTLLCGVCLPYFAQERPNILWITFEDTSPQFMGSYDNSDAETPVFDRMASQGVRYTNAFSTNTVCSPSRTSIITGVPTYELGTGNHRSNYAIPDFIKGFPKYLKDAGYYVTNNSKTDYNVKNEKDFIAETWNESSNTAGWWNKEESKPFFAVFNIADSHQSRTMSMSYEWYEQNVLNYLPVAVKNANNKLDDAAEHSQQAIPQFSEGKIDFTSLHKMHHISDTAFAMPPFYRDSPNMRKQMARVYNSLKLTDIKMGKLLERLQSEGFMENTIIFIFADHGEGMPRMKTNGIGLGYRVPFVVWFPERYKHLAPNGKTGVVTEELVSFEDLAPTVLKLANVSKPEYLKGRNFLGGEPEKAPEYLFLASDRADNGPDLVRSVTDGRYMYSRNFMPFYPELKYIHYIEQGEITAHMREDFKDNKLNETQKSIFNRRPLETLYDLKNDTWEIKNLATNTQYDSIVRKMRKALIENIKERRDVNFMPEYELNRDFDTGSAYTEKSHRAYYPISEILNMALNVGSADEQSIQNKMEGLDHKNKFVRYWAALGLYSERNSLSRKTLIQIKSKLNETYKPAQITLAAALYDRENNNDALEILKNAISVKNAETSLMAINYLLYIKNRSPFLRDVTLLNNTDAPYKVKAACLDFLNLEEAIN
ncbi:sulfatase [Leeuwenhoekiella sp. MAR_2009_132]|uniref:sulfatase family protein n=1 Tax=Leeuwenhoekiella sp. MAR_2009_132 TaxID=1392489 RepID=UPI0009DFC817|nr:sulfatase [Leeuwenhoekiella sp. MAR_2009_132]